ncbi:uncharacterized protein LY89DRAFT_783105 [Mollisia scopiformis]|uniref:Fido domain-containing protein n=1 Tax=Mollisia scopiformis TaxID=149040 RepID=A0A194X7R1_MOLSC|nr:uncharacterized protein LY89DRAFT_783105 [Mollisia scopiformis]KUJ15847.1 hypothetical protein LY89DRAFT_783105 [Mollisia scopiformis]
MDLLTALRTTIQRKYQAKPTLGLKMDQPSYDYNRFTPDPDDVLQDSIKYLSDLQPLLANLNDTSYEAYLLESMAQMIYTSNLLENAGSSHPLTLGLGQFIFASSPIEDSSFPIHSTDYSAFRSYLLSKSRKADHEAILRSRKQIIQHALAMKYIVQHMIISNENLSEDLLKETHKILTFQIDADNDERDKSETYSGIYRTSNVGHTFVSFLPPSEIAGAITLAISSFTHDLATAEQSGTLDIYAFATKIHHTILNIHPFLDGNS